ncbi:MAG: hypothetical protein K2W92_01430 [Alphaproteobacteria bacterium]|nr:hypothetical protein [Alphaproteobacteria bacterium]
MSKSILTAISAAVFSFVAFEGLQAKPLPPTSNPRHLDVTDESNAAGEKENAPGIDKQESGKF